MIDRVRTKFRQARMRRRTLGLAAAICAMLASHPAAANDASTRQMLKSMTDYMAKQQTLSAQFDVELDVVTPDIEKIKFSATGDVQLERPDKLRMSRKGGYTDVELTFDGQTTTVHDRYGNAFAQLKTPGSIDQLVDRLRNELYVEMPGVDLLLAAGFEVLMDGVVEANHIGIGVVNGVDCQHLAFRNADVDWQLWVRTGDRPLPCKYVITSKTVAGAPEYQITFRDWKSGHSIAGGAFAFKPPAGARSVDFARLSAIGELPSPTPFSD